MQAKMFSERELVKESMQELCRKAGFPDSNEMIQRDLEFLSESIDEKTGILISLSTIKRLINGEFSRLPQVATLNAIARYLGYATWQDYKFQHTQDSQIHPQDLTSQIESTTKRPDHKKRFAFKKYLVAGGVAVLATLGILVFLKFRTPGIVNIKTARFSARKTTSNEIPNTVVFSYNIDNVIADSFFIQQSWDRNRKVRIYKNNYTLTDIYYEPGYHIAKLIANDSIIRTIHVSIPTDRWFFFAKEKTARSQPKYIQAGQGINKGSLQVTMDDLNDSKVDVQKEQEYVHVYFPTNIESSSDNFVMHFRIRVKPVNNDHCPYFMTEIFCQRNFIFFTSAPKGCASEITTQFGENFQSGKTNDFSALAGDPINWQDVELMIKNKQVTIRINNQQSYSAAYRQSAGMITGLGFISNGLVEVDFVTLKTLDGNDIYSNDFE